MSEIERIDKLSEGRYIYIYRNIKERKKGVGGRWGCRDKVLQRWRKSNVGREYEVM